MERETQRAREAMLPAIEARLLEASLRQRLFQQASAPVQVGRYRLLGRLGQGAMGVVFHAHDDQLDRPVALKLLHADPGPVTQARLRREAQALARLSHPNVVQVFEVGEADGHAFVVMELVRGATLRAWLAGSPRSVREIVAVFVEAGRGLAAAHAAGLVHRDFKPDNVLVGADGRVRVVDFGLVRGDEEGATSVTPPRVTGALLTQTGAVLGTPAYMAPEARSGAIVDARSDQYGFCVALFEALHGARPGGEIKERARGVPRRVRVALRRGLERAPERRWSTMEGLLAAIDPRPGRLRMLAVGVAMALVVVAVVVAAIVGWRAWSERELRAAAGERLAAIEARLDGLVAAGQGDAAQRLLGEFLAAPDNREQGLGGRGWTTLAGLLAARGLAADEAWAHAYVLAREPAVRDAALLGLAAAHAEQRRWDEAASALTLLARSGGEGGRSVTARRLGFAVATGRRELATALALAEDPEAPEESRALAPVLARLVHMTRTERRGVNGAQIVDAGALLLDLQAVDDLPQAVLVAADASLTGGHRVDRRRVHAPGAGLLVYDEEGERVLVRAEVDGVRELQRWPRGGAALMHATLADLDGDARPELYMAQSRGLRALVPDGEGWRVVSPHAATEATNSDVDGIAAGDLDGDGALELVVAAGPWSAYDLRVFRAAGPGRLALVARRKLGHTVGVFVLRTAAGPRVIALATEAYPNSTVFPASQPRGARRGFHVFRLDGEELVHERSLALNRVADGPLIPRFFLVGDLDGDGLDDLVASVEQPATRDAGRGLTMVARQLADGEFAVMYVGGTSPLLLAQLAGDARPELLLRAEGDDALWIAGVGDRAIEATPRPGLARAEAHAQRLAQADAPAEVVALARVGALELALGAAIQAADLAAGAAQHRLQFAAAVIAEDLQRHAEAIALLAGPGDSADAVELRAAAGEHRVADHLALGELDAAVVAAAGWLATPGLPEAARSRAAAVHDPLAALIRGRSEVPLARLGERASWLDPAALRRDPAHEGLMIDSVGEQGAALAWPVTWSKGQVLIEAAITPIELQWGASLELRVVADEVPTGAPIARVTLRVTGGDHHHELTLACGGEPIGVGLSVASDGTTAALRVRLRVDPAAGASECRIFAAAGPSSVPATGRPGPLRPGGAYRLEIGPESGGVADARARVALTRLELAGVTLREPPPDPRRRAAEHLVDGDAAAALLALAADSDGPARLWRVVGLAELGRWQDAAAELTAIADDPAIASDLRRFLHGRPGALGPVLRHALGERRYLELYRAAWGLQRGATGFTPAVLRSLLTDLGGLELACAAPPRADPLCPALLVLRGRAHAQRGERDRARRDLEAALALQADDPAAPGPRSAIRIELAALAAADGDGEAALGHARAALALHPAPEIARDILRARSELATLADSPAWRELLGPDDRTLAPR